MFDDGVLGFDETLGGSPLAAGESRGHGSAFARWWGGEARVLGGAGLGIGAGVLLITVRTSILPYLLSPPMDRYKPMQVRTLQ